MTLQSKHDLIFEKPILNAAGFLGFAPGFQEGIDWDALGTFITSPISLQARTAAAPPRLIPYPGGFLLHTGHPNPGLRSAVKQYAPQWGRSPLPILVHLLAEDPDSLRQLIEALEQVEGIMGLEIGLPPGIDKAGLSALGGAAQGELPFILQLPLTEAAGLAREAVAAGAAAISLGPPRGALPAPSGRLVNGRLYGPGVFPLVLDAISRLRGMEFPIIAGGGVSSNAEADALREAGAAAVQLDYVLWRPGGMER